MIACPIAVGATCFADKCAIKLSDKAWSYAEFNQLVFCHQNSLPPLSEAMFIPWKAQDPVHTLAKIWACLRSGHIAMPVNPSFPEHFAKDLLKSWHVSDFFSEKPLKSHVTSVHNSDICLCLNNPGLGILSSGSLGFPKTVLLSVGNLYWNVKGVLEAFPMNQEDCLGLVLPLYHIGGVVAALRAFFSGASLVCISQKLSYAYLLSETMTHLPCVPTQLIRWLKEGVFSEEPSCLKQILVGGASLPWMPSWLPIVTTYGLTEMASQVLNSQNQSLNYREWKLADTGAILVKGETLFQGYLDWVGAYPMFRLPLTADGWFQTGDLGKLDHDGSLHIVGRADLMMVSGGENIHPQAIESVLLQHDHVFQAIVVGISHPEFGMRPVAFIEGFVDTKSLRDWLKERIPAYGIPDRFYAMPNLVNAGLKPNRQELTALANSLEKQ